MIDGPFRNIIKTQTAQGRGIERLRSDQTFRDIGQVYAPFHNLPALRGLWTPGNVTAAGLQIDMSNNGMHLTRNGTPFLGIYNGLVSYWDFDGVGDYFARNDEAGLDITGTETYIETAYRGLTVGGWFWFDTFASIQVFISKWSDAAGEKSWQLFANTSAKINTTLSVDGNAVSVSLANSVTVSAGVWYFIVMRYDPSTEVALWVNGTKSSTTTSIPASIRNNTVQFRIGQRADNILDLNGRMALSFLCSAYLPDALIDHLFLASKTVFDL